MCENFTEMRKFGIVLVILAASVIAYGLQRSTPPALSKDTPFSEQRAGSDLVTIVNFGPRPAGGNFNLHTLNTNEIASSKEVNLDASQTNSKSIWVCPEVSPDPPNYPQGVPYFNPSVGGTPSVQWQVGYQYLGGVTNWVNAQGTFPCLSPVKLGNAKPSWTLASEDIYHDTTTGLWNEGVVPHQRHGASYSDGGNYLSCDGSVHWIKVESMYEITTYSTSTRLWYFYQDDLSVFSAAQLAALKFP